MRDCGTVPADRDGRQPAYMEAGVLRLDGGLRRWGSPS